MREIWENRSNESENNKSNESEKRLENDVTPYNGSLEALETGRDIGKNKKIQNVKNSNRKRKGDCATNKSQQENKEDNEEENQVENQEDTKEWKEAIQPSMSEEAMIAIPIKAAKGKKHKLAVEVPVELPVDLSINLPVQSFSAPPIQLGEDADYEDKDLRLDLLVECGRGDQKRMDLPLSPDIEDQIKRDHMLHLMKRESEAVESKEVESNEVDAPEAVEQFVENCVGNAIREGSRSPSVPCDLRTMSLGLYSENDESTFLDSLDSFSCTLDSSDFIGTDGMDLIQYEQYQQPIVPPEYIENIECSTYHQGPHQQEQFPPVMGPQSVIYGDYNHGGYPMNGGNGMSPQAPLQTFNEQPVMPQFWSMNIEQILIHKLTVREICEFDVMPKFVFSNKGNRYLIHLVDSMEAQHPAMGLLFDYFMSKSARFVYDVAIHEHGNYFVQRLLEKQLEIFNVEMVQNAICPFALRISGDKFGCRVVQCILNSSIQFECKENMVSSLREQITQNEWGRESLRNLLVSVNGNHVIQEVLRLGLPVEAVDFIRTELERDIGPLSVLFAVSVSNLNLHCVLLIIFVCFASVHPHSEVLRG